MLKNMEVTAQRERERVQKEMREAERAARLARNRRGVTLNLQSGEGRDLLRRLIATSDVLVENFTPRVLESMGLTYDEVRAVRPDVIIELSGWGPPFLFPVAGFQRVVNFVSRI